MDTVSRRRRVGGAGEPEKEAEAYDLAYQTALSQTGGAEAPPGFVLRGEASPGTLEMGGGSGIEEADLPTANPFHSERVRSEVQLIRSRPQTLDADGRRLRGEVDESGLGDLAGPPLTAEPDYSTGIGGGPATEEAPRVARIEPATDVGSPSGVRGATPCVIDLTEATPRETKQSTSGGESTRLLSGPQGVGKEDDPEVQEEDTRELIPADTDRLTRVEMLLGQVLEENRALKRQLQAESHSSYHSTRTPQEVPVSPASFGLGYQFAEAHQGPPFGVQPVDNSVALDFPGALGRLAKGELVARPAVFCRGQASRSFVGRSKRTSFRFGWFRIPGCWGWGRFSKLA